MDNIDFIKNGFGIIKREANRPFIFIHINKTGGTSISRALKIRRNPTTPINITKNHRTAMQTKEVVGKEVWDKAYKFTVVRNPWSKVVSEYNYRVAKNQNELSVKKIPFNDWVVRTYLEKDPFYHENPIWFMPQVDWLIEEDQKIHMDYIARIENLKKDFKNICRDLRLRVRLPKKNVSRGEKKHYSLYYNADTAMIIKNHFARDVEYFGYSFETIN